MATEDITNRILLYLGIRPEEASDEDRKLAEVLKERIGGRASGHAYLDEARLILGNDSPIETQQEDQIRGSAPMSGSPNASTAVQVR